MKFFQKYLSVWVILCMIIGVSIGHFFPMIPNILNKFEYAGISIPMAVLIWIMIYPMMIKVDFKSVKYISKNPKGLFVTWIVNWLIKPFTMYGLHACSSLGYSGHLFRLNLLQNIWLGQYCLVQHHAQQWYLYGAV